jgi:hypothetical protein
MTIGRQLALSIAFFLFAPSAMPAGTTTRLWLDGELLSRKTVPVGRTFVRNQYVYRVRGFNCTYLVVSDMPLQMDLYVPMRFSAVHKQIFIQGTDGKEYKARILQKDVVSSHRH